MGFLKRLTSFPKTPRGTISKAAADDSEASEKHNRDNSQELGEEVTHALVMPMREVGIMPVDTKRAGTGG